MGVCIYPGSFDPPTKGHVDIIHRASEVFDEVIVAVMINRAKKGCFPIQKREEMLKMICSGMPRVKIDLWDGLLCEYIKKKPGAVVIRGIRNAKDFEQEYDAHTANKSLFPSFETVFFAADHQLSYVSSSMVREIASFGGDISPFVPESIKDDICSFFQEQILLK